mgnify:CR=1 FL=1
MTIVVRLDVALAKRKMTSRELALQVGISEQNLSILRSGRASGIRFTTLDAICRILGCQPGELLEYMPDAEGPPEDLVVNG